MYNSGYVKCVLLGMSLSYDALTWRHYAKHWTCWRVAWFNLEVAFCYENILPKGAPDLLRLHVISLSTHPLTSHGMKVHAWAQQVAV